MPQVENAPEELNALLEKVYASALKTYKGDKAKASAASWAAAKSAGWTKKKGKWVKTKKGKTEMADVTIDAFAAGKYPQGEFTQKEIEEIAETYDPQNYEAPITIGHVSDYKGQTQIPAFGWIGAIKVVGDHLKLIASQFSDELKTWYKEGKYKKVSAAFFDPSSPSNPTPGKWHLHHLAFLGAAPPQVKGLEGIAFSAMDSGLEFAEMPVSIEGMDPIEKAGTEDTLENIQESFARALSQIEEALTSDAEYSVKQQRMYLAVSDCYSEIQSEIDEHFAFIKKIEDMEEKSEYSEHKGRLIELAQKIFSTKKRKEQDAMDATKEKELTEKIAELEAQNKEFAEAKAKADADALAAKEKADAELKAAEEKAADDKLKAEIKDFCEKNKLNTKLMDDLHIQEVMFAAAKANASLEFGEKKATLLQMFQELALKFKSLPEGTMDKEFASKAVDDTSPEVIKNARKYISAHAKEFSAIPEEALSQALKLHAFGQIKF